MAKSKNKCCDQSDLTDRMDEMFALMNASAKQNKKISKKQKKLLAAIAELEDTVKNLKVCKCRKKKKKKSSKSAAENTNCSSQSNALQVIMSAPREGMADDLKLIAGVGPKLEQTLNDLGVFHFDQIAAWTGKEVAWVDDYLMFTGRIERDEWIKQAQALAKGGREEYVRVFGKEPR